MTAGRARAEVEVPAAVAAIAGERRLRVVWENEVGGLTFEVGVDPDRYFVKWTPAGNGQDLGREAARLSWAAAYTPVPRLLDQGGDEAGSWIVTAPLPGRSAVVDHWEAQPRTAVTAIGAGLRALHEALPVTDCPFSWSAADRLAQIRDLASRGGLDPDRWASQHRQLGADRALRMLADIPPVDQLVVCHGDTCAPNTLLSDDGRWSGHVDLGALGVADRWADLAIATWSTVWNYGTGWENLLLDAYGIGPDPDRTRYYRLLWDLDP